jgi:hypothetical protein
LNAIPPDKNKSRIRWVVKPARVAAAPAVLLTRGQSIASTSSASCAGVNVSVLSTIGGHEFVALKTLGETDTDRCRPSTGL